MQQKWVVFIFIVALTFMLALTAIYALTLVYQSRSEIQKLVEPSHANPMLYHIAVLLPESSDPFIQQLKENIEKAVTSKSCAAEFLFFPVQESLNSFLTSSKAGDLFKIAINAYVDGIIMFFNDTINVNSFAEYARLANIPFTAITLDNVPGNHTIYTVSSDSYIQGKLAIQEAVAALGNNAKIGVILPYSKKLTSTADDFLTGIHTALIEQGKGNLQAIAFEGDPKLGGEEASFSLLSNYPSINVIICSTAQTSMSTAQFIIDKGLVGKVLLIGADESTEILRLLDKGIFKALIIRDAHAIGETSVDLIMKQIQHDSASLKNISIKPLVKLQGK